MSTNIVKSNQKFQLNFFKMNRPEVISEITSIINECLPLIQGIEILNRTKKCLVTTVVTGGKLFVTIVNPDDETFNCNEESNATTITEGTDRGTGDNGR